MFVIEVNNMDNSEVLIDCIRQLIVFMRQDSDDEIESCAFLLGFIL
jgi:hypothetical protein